MEEEQNIVMKVTKPKTRQVNKTWKKNAAAQFKTLQDYVETKSQKIIDPQHHFFQSLQKKLEIFAWLKYKSGFKVPKSIQEDVTKVVPVWCMNIQAYAGALVKEMTKWKKLEIKKTKK